MSVISASSFICKYENCNKFFKEPIILPCGYSICQHHINDLMNENKKHDISVKFIDERFKCNLCKKCHLIIADYNINISLKEIVDKNYHLNENYVEMRTMLQDFEQTLEQIANIQNNPNGFINGYITEIKDKVQMQRQNLK